MTKKSETSLADFVQASREKTLKQSLTDQGELLYLIAEKTARAESTPPEKRELTSFGVAVDFAWIGRSAAGRQRRFRALTELAVRGLIVRGAGSTSSFVRLTPTGRVTCGLPPDGTESDFG